MRYAKRINANSSLLVICDCYAVLPNPFTHHGVVRPPLVVLAPGFFIPPATGADVSIEGVMGETITLHGVSYVGDNVYLFLTGRACRKMESR